MNLPSMDDGSPVAIDGAIEPLVALLQRRLSRRAALQGALPNPVKMTRLHMSILFAVFQARTKLVDPTQPGFIAASRNLGC